MTQEDTSDDQGFSFHFGPTDEEQRARVVEIKDHLASIKVDWTREYAEGEMPSVVVTDEIDAGEQVVSTVKEVTQKVGAVLGLFEHSSPEGANAIHEPQIDIIDQEKLENLAGENTLAFTQGHKVFLGSVVVSPQLDITRNIDEFKKILGDDITPDSDAAVALSKYRLQGTIAHEFYHLRQKKILNYAEIHRKKPKPEESETKKKLDAMYVFDKDERGARAFDIRYLREERKALDDSSLEAQVLDKYIASKIQVEQDLSGQHKTIMDIDRQIVALQNMIPKKTSAS